jgi:3-oxoacyl-[acyl-carrier protein] reductase
MDLRFDGKVILVTGASGGIGAAIVEAFAESGGTVIAHYRERRQETEALVDRLRADGRTVFALGADLADLGAAANLIEEVVERWGSIDVLVNNAGALLRRVPVADTDDVLYHRTFDVNFGSIFATCRAVIPAMRSAGRGCIVNVSSVAARSGGGGNAVIYAAAKGAVTTFTRGLANELAGQGIRVNALEPGLIDSTFHSEVTAPNDFVRMSAGVPMQRAGRSEECAGVVLFLASDYASYITGQSVGVNGGLSMP